MWRSRWSAGVTIVERLVPDELWEPFQRVVPPAPTRRQGGGRRHGDREVSAAIIFMATSGRTRQQLPSASFGPSGATAHRRFTQWTRARVWARLHRLVLDEPGARGELHWTRCAIDSVNLRALEKGELTGPNRSGPGTCGSKIHLITDRDGLRRARAQWRGQDPVPALIKDAGAVGVDPRTGVDGCGLYVCVEAEAPGLPWRRQSGVRGRIGPCQGVEQVTQCGARRAGCHDHRCGHGEPAQWAHHHPRILRQAGHVVEDRP